MLFSAGASSEQAEQFANKEDVPVCGTGYGDRFSHDFRIPSF